ncbi:hypothetical protein C4565_11040 [Candidatus Parcubacteria bacterium]|nr:MAG: hypothetical protein C4565_11040 [Candidatus Parcubacteria bacterium]
MNDVDLAKEISKLKKQINALSEDIINRLERIEAISKSEDDEDNSKEEDEAEDIEENDEDEIDYNIDPYGKLTKYSYEAINQIKKDMINALAKGSKSSMEEANERARQITKMVNDVIKIIEKMKKRDEERIEITNPLYPHKKILGKIPGTLRLNLHSRGATKWLGFLLTGVGVLIFSRGIWDATEVLFSIQGSLIIGAAIIILMAWLERKKIFAVFGEG